MEFKGTKGKWKIGRNSDAKLEVYMNGNYRAKVFGYGANTTDEDKANAQLIAAAPELLQALQLTINSIRERGYAGLFSCELKGADTIISKALGKEASNE